MELSSSLKSTNADESARSWLADTVESSALIGAFLSVIHPELYAIGRAALIQLANDPNQVKEPLDLLEVLKVWSIPFSSISVISNRQSPFHRDNARKPWYDVLATFGNHKNGVMELPGLGMRLLYNPGTMVGISGKIVRHGVAACEGDRVCVAYYMKDRIHERLGLPAPQWMKLQYYEKS